MYFSIRVHYEDSCCKYIVGEIIEKRLDFAQDDVVEKFARYESDEVFIYSIYYNGIIDVTLEASYDFRPKLF